MMVRMRNKICNSLLAVMQNGTILWEDSLSISYKAISGVTNMISNHAPRYLYNWIKRYMSA